ncbi:MAG: lamin tail domain-containing protein [Saprospiraceae bacterium]|nr:lamin tail domain-containing protein [Saprospiraceae bacterium]
MMMVVVSQFNTFGNVAPMVTFPSLTNTGDKLILVDTTGKEIHSIQYSDAWYGSTLKKNGGYSLELKNPDNICDLSSNNWSGSNDFSGGTPGKANSILTTNNTIYEVNNVKINSSTQIQINFSKLLNSSLLSISNFNLNGTNANISTITVDSSVVTIDLKNPLIGDGKFELQMNDIYNCDGKENITNIAEFYLEKPFVQAVKLLSDKQVQIDFSIDMQNASLQNSSNYSIDQSVGAPSSISILTNNSIVLNFNKALISGLNYNLQIKNVLSSFETTLKDTIFTIKYFTPSAINSYDLLINEIMADPSPTIGLPDAEYIEIYKNTSNYINLKDLKLIVGSNEFILPDYDFKGNTTNYVVIFTNKTGLDFGTNDTLSLAKNLNLTNDGTSISNCFKFQNIRCCKLFNIRLSR